MVSGVLAQLVNHPSVARYSMANEFYNNVTFSPIACAAADALCPRWIMWYLRE